METWNEEQIELCRQLSEKLPKREPKVGGWWAILGCEDFICRHYSKEPFDGCEDLSYPLYTVEELLEILRGKANLSSNKEAKRIFDEIDIAIGDENLKTALLKLAVEVAGGK